MPIELMPSQQIAYQQLVKMIDKVDRRKKYLLLSGPRTGKTTLLKKWAEDMQFVYINYTREILAELIKTGLPDNIRFYDFENKLKKYITDQGFAIGQVVIIDEVDSAIMLMTKGLPDKLRRWANTYLSLDHSFTYILSSSIYNNHLIDQMSIEHPEKLVQLFFNNSDKKYIQEKLFANVGLFDFTQIQNISQMINKKVGVN